MHANRAFYSDVLKIFDKLELKALQNELEASPFRNWCVAVDFASNVGSLRVYYVSPEFKVAQRVLAISMLHRVNHHTVYDFVKSGLENAGADVSGICSWLADGCSVNGVQDDQNDLGQNVWAMLRDGGSPRC